MARQAAFNILCFSRRRCRSMRIVTGCAAHLPVGFEIAFAVQQTHRLKTRQQSVVRFHVLRTQHIGQPMTLAAHFNLSLRSRRFQGTELDLARSTTGLHGRHMPFARPVAAFAAHVASQVRDPLWLNQGRRHVTTNAFRNRFTEQEFSQVLDVVLWPLTALTGREAEPQLLTARLFGLYPRKGAIAAGSDADIVIWDSNAEHLISAATHHMRVDYSMFEGFRVTGNARTVISRGEVIVDMESSPGTLDKAGISGGQRAEAHGLDADSRQFAVQRGSRARPSQ